MGSLLLRSLVVVGGSSVTGFWSAIGGLGGTIAWLRPRTLVLGEGPEEAAEGCGLGPHHARHEVGLGVHHALGQVQLGVQQILLQSDFILDQSADVRELGFGQLGKRQLREFWK